MNFCIYILLLIILLLSLYNSRVIEPFTLNNEKLKMNHYKYKSVEEYELRMKEYNKNGYMKNKLSASYNHKKTDNIKNTTILKYVNKLKKHMKIPLQKLKRFSDKYKYFASVVVMFRFEDDYLDEWLHYYIMHGIDHFYMYSNMNTYKTYNILQPYINKGYITLIKWDDDMVPIDNRREQWNHYHKTSTQNLAFRDFVRKYKDETKWIIKADIDEFIYPENTKLYIKDILLSSDKNYLRIPRTDFGNNYYKKKPNGLVIKNYVMSKKERSSLKVIALTKDIHPECTGSAHSFKMIKKT